MLLKSKRQEIASRIGLGVRSPRQRIAAGIVATEATQQQGFGMLALATRLARRPWINAQTDTGDILDLIQAFNDGSATAKFSAKDAPAGLNGSVAFRNAYETLIGTTPRTMFDQCVDTIARSTQVSSPASSVQDQITDIIKTMVTNTQTVQSRNINRPAFVRGSVYKSSGRWAICCVDENGNPLEHSIVPDTITATVERDAVIGIGGPCFQPGEEIWRLKGLNYSGEIERSLAIRGSGINDLIKSVVSDNSLLQNASFSDIVGGDATPTAVTGWLNSTTGAADTGPWTSVFAGNGTDVIADRLSTSYFQASKAETTPGCLRIIAHNIALGQYMSPQTGVTVGIIKGAVDRSSPYDHSVAASFSNAVCATWMGTVEVGHGSYSTVYPVTGAVPAGTPGGGGSVDTGTHYYCYTCTEGGVEGPPSPISAAVVLAAANHTVALTNLLDADGTATKTLYRTKAADSADAGKVANHFYKVATIINGTTTYSDTTADAGLTTALPWDELPDANGYVVIPVIPPSLSATSATQKNRWPLNFDKPTALFFVRFKWTSGTLALLDRSISVAMGPLDGTSQGPGAGQGVPAWWGVMRSGSTPSQTGDLGTWAWTLAGTDGFIQERFGMIYSRSLPSTTGAPTYADPSSP